MTGVGFTAINSELLGSRILSTLLAFLVLSAGVYYLLSYFFGRQNCTTCNKITPSEKGKSICISCHKITAHPAKIRQNIFGSIILAVFGIFGITSLLFEEISSITQYFDWTGYLIMLCIGVYGISTNIGSTHYCAMCGDKNSTISLDTPKAQALIKEHNLTIPEEAVQQSTSSTQSN